MEKRGWGGSRKGAGRKAKSKNEIIVNRACLYVLVEDGVESICKIGITEDLFRRLASLQSANWRRLTVAAAFPLHNMALAKEIEHRLLTHFAKSIIRGEWLSVSPQQAKEAIENGLRSIQLPVFNLVEEISSPISNLNIIKFERNA